VRLLNKVQSQFRKKIKATPRLLAYTAASLAAQHAAALEKHGFLPEASRADEVMKELLRAYFCLVSLHAARCLEDTALNHYGAAMLDALREYPEPGEEGELIRHVFGGRPFLDAQWTALDDAIASYVHGGPSETDRQTIEDHRRLLNLSEDNPVHFFAGKLHLRIMRILGIEKQNLVAFLPAWIVTSAQVVAAVSVVLKEVVPVLEK